MRTEMRLNLPKIIADQILSDVLSVLPACKLSGMLQGMCQAHGLL